MIVLQDFSSMGVTRDLTRNTRAPVFGSCFVCLSLLFSSAFTLNEDLRVVGETDVRLSLFDLFKQAEFCQDTLFTPERHSAILNLVNIVESVSCLQGFVITLMPFLVIS